MTYLDELLRSQLGKPSGLLGSLVIAPILNFANAGLVNTAIELLAPKPTDVVLDIGFGGGDSLWAMAAKIPVGKVVGVDYSSDMVAGVEQQIRQRRLMRQVSVQCGDVARLPFRAGTFDKIVTINSLYYWPDPKAGLREIFRVLKRRGSVAVGFHSAESLRPFTRDWEGFTLYAPQDVANLMQEAHLQAPRIEHRDRWHVFDTVVVTAHRH